MKKTTLDKIYFIILCTIIFLLNFVVGSSHNEPKTLIEIFMILSTTVYIFIKKFQSEENVVIKSKIDILAIIFCFITFIPLILKNYYSLNDTVNACMMCLSVLSIYILSRNLLNTPKKINIFIDVVIASSILTVIFGLDELFYYSFENLHNLLGNSRTTAYGMTANFGYSNTLTAYLTFTIMLALGRFFVTENKKIKYLYISYIQIGMIGFVYGNSRALMVMFAVTFLVYLIFIKDTKKILQAIWIIISNLIIAFVFEAVLNRFVTSNWNLWLFFTLDIIFVYLLNYLFMDKIFKIKINKKIFIIAIIVLIITSIIYFLTASKIGMPKEINEKDIIYLEGLKKSNEYNIKIELNAEIQDEATITLFEKNVEHVSIKEYNENISNGYNTVEFNTSTAEDFSRFLIKISNISGENSKIIINKIYINDKEYIFNYKYIPNEVMRLVKTLNYRTKSVYERVEYYKAALNLSKNHIIFGAGGRAYFNHILPYYTYKHSCYHDPHSYIMTLLTNYGIVGLSTYCIILAITFINVVKYIKKLSKEKEKNYYLYLSIFFALTIYIIHSLVDFDLSYLLTASLFYIFVGILNNSENKIERNAITSITDYIVMICFACTLFVLGGRLYGEKLVKDERYEESVSYCPYSSTFKIQLMNYAKRTDDIELVEKYLFKYIEDEKYKSWNSVYMNFEYICKEVLKDNNYEKAVEYLNKYYTYFIENNNTNENYPDQIKSRNYHIESLIKSLDEDEKALEIKGISELYEKFKKELKEIN